MIKTDLDKRQKELKKDMALALKANDVYWINAVAGCMKFSEETVKRLALERIKDLCLLALQEDDGVRYDYALEGILESVSIFKAVK